MDPTNNRGNMYQTDGKRMAEITAYFVGIVNIETHGLNGVIK
jgi:hypothetical protein